MASYEDDHGIASSSSSATSAHGLAASAPPHDPANALPADAEADPYAARPAPASFTEFLDEITRLARAGGGLTIDEDLYLDIFESGPNAGASPAFIASLPRPSPAHPALSDASAECPICLQPLHAIATEEEYALAADHYFGDAAALGVRALPCRPGSGGGHVVCARCAQSWLKLNNTCPLCRAKMDVSVATPDDDAAAFTREQEHAGRMLELFRAVFGPQAAAAGERTGPDGQGGAAAMAHGIRIGRAHGDEDEDGGAYAGMYS
ncbi:hypothetical protein Q5752_004828 [Cryptotrichosporon argae]